LKAVKNFWKAAAPTVTVLETVANPLLFRQKSANPVAIQREYQKIFLRVGGGNN
jgi:hypothetical protein